MVVALIIWIDPETSNAFMDERAYNSSYKEDPYFSGPGHHKSWLVEQEALHE